MAPDRTREGRNTHGVSLEADFTLSAAGDAVEGTAGGFFCQPQTGSAIARGLITERHFHFAVPTKVTIKRGAALAVSCEEIVGFPTGAFPTKTVPATNLFVVLQPVWIPTQPAAPAPAARQTPAPATPAPAAK